MRVYIRESRRERGDTDQILQQIEKLQANQEKLSKGNKDGIYYTYNHLVTSRSIISKRISSNYSYSYSSLC